MEDTAYIAKRKKEREKQKASEAKKPTTKDYMDERKRHKKK